MPNSLKSFPEKIETIEQKKTPHHIKFHRSLFEDGKRIFLHSKCPVMLVTTISALQFPDNYSLKRPTRKDKEKRTCITALITKDGKHT